MKSTRRKFLLTVSTIGIGGCLSKPPFSQEPPEDSDSDGVPNGDDVYPSDPFRSEDAFIESPGDIELQSGSYARVPVASQKARPLTVEYSVTVHNGFAVNVFLISRDEFKAYQRGENFEYFPSESRILTSNAEATFTVRESEYLLLIEHPESDNSVGNSIQLTVTVNGYY